MAAQPDAKGMDFIEHSLPPAPARILDAGCGDGALAARLIERGYAVTAIDVDPALRSPLVRVADICTYEDEPFDAVIFSLSLHHVHSLERALERARALLKPGGRLIIDEFAHEAANDRIADAFFGTPGSLPRWRERHGDYHTGRAMRAAIAARFTVDAARRVPYLHRYLEDETHRHTESVLGLQIAATAAPRRG
ncbi:class I SAM-dependent methyltransferase [Streptomyces sp. A7024]|uniref:Class I SAM-dependent methyltransferase n=1 Tax=Streptomyces coryli TaxID=1128680 RepID=A0A6G4U517_9ACTN|nr:class I SAM-dependent methyltransferase [Streptomyces coryli]NGN66830.1 class I SAM-dependent methyltransferase [Streptomyces coryli]